VVELLKQLTEAFAINICAYAVMRNHSHIVVHVDRSQALAWTDKEVISRWTMLYKPTPIVARYLDDFVLTQAEQDAVAEEVDKWRHRLYDISWLPIQKPGPA
jgi:REP element-mobilizing transposase RayT